MGTWRRVESGIIVPDEVAGSWDRVARNRFVAHADMLEMAGLTVRDPKLAWNAVSKMTRARQRVFDLAFTVSDRYTRIRDRVAAFTFSDTIVLFTQVTTKKTYVRCSYIVSNCSPKCSTGQYQFG
jgi:hypothetical protein